MVEKVINKPALIEQIKGVIDRRLESGKIRHGAHLNWHCIMELINQPDAFRNAVLEDSYQMRKLRRKTPFVGILTEDERQHALLNVPEQAG